MVAKHKLLVDRFLSKKPGEKRWFVRGMRDLPPAEQEQVWKTIEGLGHERFELPPLRSGEGKKKEPPPVHHAPPPPPPEPKVKERVSWSEDEWDRLTEIVFRSRMNDPMASLGVLADNAQQQFPEHRRRSIGGSAMLQPLIDRLDKKFADLRSDAENSYRLRDRINQMTAAPSKGEVLKSLSDQEVLFHFRNRVLDLVPADDVVNHMDPRTLLECLPFPGVLGFVVQSLVEKWSDGFQRVEGHFGGIASLMELLSKPNGNGHVNGKPVPAPPKPSEPVLSRKPRVTVIGMLPDQTIEVRTKLSARANFNFVDKNRSGDYIPDGTDIVMVWTRFASHSDSTQATNYARRNPGTTVLLHHGGIKKMIEMLDKEIRKKSLSLAVA